MLAFEHVHIRSNFLILVGILIMVFVSSRGHAQDAVDYSSYVGGTGEEFGVGSHQLPNGDVILVMQTGSTGLTTTDQAAKPDLTGKSDAYIIRFSPNDREIVWASYFGGDLQDWVFGMDCDDEASTCGFAGASEIQAGGTRAFAAIFGQNGDLVCSTTFDAPAGSSVGNHYDDPPEDDDFDGYDPTQVDFEIGPVIFGSVRSDRGDLDGAMWMIEAATCDTIASWQTNIPEDDTFFHGFVNPDPSDASVAIHGFGAKDANSDGMVSDPEAPLQCVWAYESGLSWHSECTTVPLGPSSPGQVQVASGEFFVESAYHDWYGILATTFEPRTGESSLHMWPTTDPESALATTPTRSALGIGLARGLSLGATGLATLTKWHFDGPEFEGVDVLRGFVRLSGDDYEAPITFLEPFQVEGGPRVQLIPGSSPHPFRESLTGYALPGIEVSDHALQAECPGFAFACAYYVEVESGLNYVSACNITTAEVDWRFSAGEPGVDSKRASMSLTWSGSLDVVQCTRLLPWPVGGEFEFLLFDSEGDSTAFRSDEGLNGPFVSIVADTPPAAINLPGLPQNQRAHMFYVANYLEDEVEVSLETGTEDTGSHVILPHEGLWWGVEPGGSAQFNVRSERNDSGQRVTFPYRDFMHHAVIWPDRRPGEEGGHNAFVFDDSGAALSGVGGPWSPTAAGPVEVPIAFGLLQNYPNPFSRTTTLRYTLGQIGAVEVIVFDAAGKRVRTLESTVQSVGSHAAIWDGLDEKGRPVAAGLYLFQLKTAIGILTRKMVVVR